MESIFLKLAQYPIAETERLLLRPVTLDDAEAMFECTDKKKRRFSLWTKSQIIKLKDVGICRNWYFEGEIVF